MGILPGTVLYGIWEIVVVWQLTTTRPELMLGLRASKALELRPRSTIGARYCNQSSNDTSAMSPLLYYLSTVHSQKQFPFHYRSLTLPYDLVDL